MADKLRQTVGASKFPKSFVSRGAMFAAALLLAGCAKVEGYVKSLDLGGPPTAPKFDYRSGPKLPPAGLPRYITGESFTFDDGRRQTVLRTMGEKVNWRLNSQTTATAYRNFLIPRLSWQSRSRESRSQTTVGARLLWPLKVGNDARFNLTQSIAAKRGGKAAAEANKTEPDVYKQDWRCAVERTETLTVPAGIFDTFKIACFRANPDTGSWRQTRVYHYAPKVGHFVSRRDYYASRDDRQILLTSAGFDSRVLSRARQASLVKTLARTLDRSPDRSPTVWRQGGLTVTLTPIKSYRNAAGARCRTYTSTYHLADRTRTNRRKVCRDSKGRWRKDRGR